MNFKRLVGFFIIFLMFSALADETNDFIEIPSKTIQFLNRSTQKPIVVEAYSFGYEMKYNCTTPDCKTSNGVSSGESELRVKGDIIQTLVQKIPVMPRSGKVMLTYKLVGVCKGDLKCSASMTLEQFVKTPEPVVILLDFDPVASDNEIQKRKEARVQYFAEIQQQMGRDMAATAAATTQTRLPAQLEVLDWKKIEANFRENRKKVSPMAYSDEAIAKLGLKTIFCPKDLKQKVEKCEFISCVFQTEKPDSKQTSDFIVHGINSAGNCAISAPTGKRYFVPKTDLPFFYDVLSASYSNSSSTIQLSGVDCKVTPVGLLEATAPQQCKEKKADLLRQLESHHLTTDFSFIRIGFQVKLATDE